MTGPFVAFDSFDCWHGSGKWESEAKKSLIDGSKNPMESGRNAKGEFQWNCGLERGVNQTTEKVYCGVQ